MSLFIPPSDNDLKDESERPRAQDNFEHAQVMVILEMDNDNKRQI